MQDMIFTPELTGHLKLISKAVEEFTKDGIKKSEQFACEIEAIKSLLDEAKEMANAFGKQE